MEELGIAALNLAYQNSNTALGNGNSLAQIGSYETTNGVTHDMADVNFESNSQYSEFTDHIQLTNEQMQTANLKGIGRVRDLREAAALSGDLASKLKAYSEADTKAQQMALIDDLLLLWAKTDPKYDPDAVYSLGNDWEASSSEGIALTPTQANQLLLAQDEAWLSKFAKYKDKLDILSAFTGDSRKIFYTIDPNQLLINIDKAYNSLVQSVYQRLLFQTRLQPYLNQMGLIIKDNELHADFTDIAAAFNQVFQENPEKAFVDLSDFLSYKSEINNQWPEGYILLGEYLDYADQNNLRDIWLNQTSLSANGFLIVSDKNTSLNGTQGNDFLYGDNKNNTLSGGNGNDLLIGGAGNDKLYAGSGNDTLIGGTGNDYMEGGAGNDTYVFSKGHGQDTILEDGSSAAGSDTIQFTDVSLSEVVFQKDGYDLIISGYNDGDSIRVQNFFYSSYYEIENFVFKDQSVTLAELRKQGMTFQQTSDGNGPINWEGISFVVASGRALNYMEDSNVMTRQASTFDQYAIAFCFDNMISQQSTLAIADNHYSVNNQIQQLVSAMAAFTSGNHEGIAIPEEIKQLTQQNNLAAYWGN